MMIDYIIKWPVIKIVKDAEADIITNFLVQKIFIYYGLSKELLLDNNTNFLANIIEHYL